MPPDRDAVLLRTTAEVLVAMCAAAERNDRLAICEEAGRLLNAVLAHRDAARPKDEALRRAVERLSSSP